jgi:hypothetical protein
VRLEGGPPPVQHEVVHHLPLPEASGAEDPHGFPERGFSAAAEQHLDKESDCGV